MSVIYKNLHQLRKVLVAPEMQGILNVVRNTFCVSHFQNFQSAISYIGATEATLIVDVDCSVTADTTVPDNVSITRCAQAGIHVADGKTLTFVGKFLSPKTACFYWTGTGSIVFSEGSVSKVYPEWFGANDSVDSHDALQKCFDSYDIVDLTDSYLTSSAINLTRQGQLICGESSRYIDGKAKIRTTSNITMFNILADGIKFQSVCLYGNGTGDAAMQIFNANRTDHIQDIDLIFDNCIIGNSYKIGYLNGRGLTIYNSAVVAFLEGIDLDFSGLTEGGNSDQKTNSGFRTISFTNNRVHSGGNAWLFYNTKANADKIWGIQINNNYMDTTTGIWRGTLNLGSICNNVILNNGMTTGALIYVPSPFSINNSNVAFNVICGMDDNGYGTTKEMINIVAANSANGFNFSNNVVKRCSQNVISLITTSSNVNIDNNVFTDCLLAHRAPTQRYIVSLPASVISAFSFTNNKVNFNAATIAAATTGDPLVQNYSTVSYSNYTGNTCDPKFLVPIRQKSVSYAASVAVDASMADYHLIGSLTGNITLATPVNGVQGQSIRIRLVQDATGGRTMTLGANMVLTGSITTTANTVTTLGFDYDGTKWRGSVILTGQAI
jgi:hypothetical protein